MLDRFKNYVMRLSVPVRVGALLAAAVFTFGLVILFSPVASPTTTSPGLTQKQSNRLAAATAQSTISPHQWTLPGVASSISPGPWTPPSGYADQFITAKRSGWAIAPVREVKLDSSMITGGIVDASTLPKASAAEVQLLTNCLCNGDDVYASGYKALDLDTQTRTFNQVLAVHPHFYYAEFRLAAQYGYRGQAAQYRLWMERALEDSPAILAGRFQYANGKPIAGVTFNTWVAYRVSNTVGRNELLTVDYDGMVTDQNGCYYVPVETGIYQYGALSNLWGNNEGDSFFDKMVKTMAIEYVNPWDYTYTSDARVGLLPPTVARRYIQYTGDYGQAQTSEEHPLRISSDRLAISWNPSAGATRYQLRLTEVWQSSGYGLQERDQDITPFVTSDWDRYLSSSVNLPLGGLEPVFNRTHRYKLHVTALHNDDYYADSRDFWFTVPSGAAPLPVNKRYIELAMPGYTVQSIQSLNGEVIVRCSKPARGLINFGYSSTIFNLPLEKYTDLYTGRGSSQMVHVEMRFKK